MLLEEGSEACREGDEVGISYPDSLVTGLRSGDDLYMGEGNLQGGGQQAAAGCVGFAVHRWGSDGYFQDSFPDSDDLIPLGPRPDENREEKIRTPHLEVQVGQAHWRPLQPRCLGDPGRA